MLEALFIINNLPEIKFDAVLYRHKVIFEEGITVILYEGSDLLGYFVFGSFVIRLSKEEYEDCWWYFIGSSH